ncbi:MAG: TetR/AcrR family transcriptional regulator [Brevinemataceae bacterium]
MSKISRKDQAITTEKNIINATIHLLKTHSFQELQIKQICQQANTSIGNFYHHFQNKHGILIKILDSNYTIFIAETKKISKTASLEHIIIILQKFCYLIEELGYELVLELFIYSMIFKDNFLLDVNKPLYNSIYQEVNKLRNKSKILSKDTDTEITKNIIIVFRGFLYEWCLSKDSYNLTQNITQQLTKYLTLFSTT